MHLNTNLNNGTKWHLKKYAGIRVSQSGKPYAKLAEGVPHTACNMRKDALNMVEFSEQRKFAPESVCKKCEKRFLELMSEFKQIKAGAKS